MSSVTTSIVVQFSQNADGLLNAEIDGREEGLNGGKTSFFPGDIAYFLVFKSPNVVIDAVLQSAGQITVATPGDFVVEEEWVSFLDTNEGSAAKYISSDFTYQWFGNNLGAVTVRDGKMVAASKGVGELKIRYKSAYTAYALHSPSSINGKNEFSIAVLVKGHN